MTSHPEYNQYTSGLAVAEAFADRIKGKNVVVTGVAPIGLGEATAIAFASQNPAKLVLVNRTEEKLKKSAENIHKLYPDVEVDIVILDLSSQRAIEKAAKEIGQKVNKIDFLINNAGCVTHHRRWTDEKIEYQLGVNHIGPFLLTNLLLPLLLKAAETSAPGETRVINLSSQGHRLSPIRFADYNFQGKPLPEEERPFANLPPAFAKETEPGYNPIIAYSQSKTANILFTRYLKDHLSSAGIASFSIHPGGVLTDLSREHDPETAAQMKKTTDYWKTPDVGASTTLVAALDPALDKSDGLYMSDCQIAECSDYASDPRLAERLWHLSEELTGRTYALAA
ncbi:Short-chain dehydrogenase/reductase family oxidoreductase [Pleurostoma richardsiae]|uniref:Short-chain dehydrogenase/reductase family oxidoreductase n=1 Tax=Pleurostoma richardsiae TaxID=41990 RepID=A0AA38VKG5_9PEZI|nr:Short-chain dehydrogenase/reductase family oxidoreductase [Pleurostoma richardsiae]